MQKQEREFVKSLSKKYHSQGMRSKVVQLMEGVTVTLWITYFHRCRTPTAGQNGRRGMFPMLLLLGISGHDTPQARKQMAKAAALLGSFEEAVAMLAEQGIDVSVNPLRGVTAGMGRMLQRMTNQGSLTVSENASGRRIVVSMDGGRVRLGERRRGNQRVKSNATYWLRDNAETMIRLRAWIKAGRAEELFQKTTCVTPDLAV